MVFNIPEADENGPKTQAEEDYDKIKEILTFIDDDIVTPELNENRVTRIGKIDVTRPRPIKIEFHSSTPRDLALRNARQLKDFTKYPKMRNLK